jgi:hypothetical protein
LVFIGRGRWRIAIRPCRVVDDRAFIGEGRAPVGEEHSFIVE